MHGFDYSVPHFITRVRGMRIAVTTQIVANVLRIPRVEFLDYPSCECFKMSLNLLSVSALMIGVNVSSLTI